MNDSGQGRPEEIWIGPMGPIEITGEDDPRRRAANRASKIVQAASSLQDLIDLVENSPDPRVRAQAIPRLSARFRGVETALKVLIHAIDDEDRHVRFQAYG